MPDPTVNLHTLEVEVGWAQPLNLELASRMLAHDQDHRWAIVSVIRLPVRSGACIQLVRRLAQGRMCLQTNPPNMLFVDQPYH